MNIKFNTCLVAILIVCFCAFPMAGMSNVRAKGIPPEAATVPTPVSPSGTISDTTPTFTWTKVTGATQYQLAVYNGSSLAYPVKTVAASACGTSTCSSTPATALSYATHSWKVRAYVGSAWTAYSAYKGFTITNIPTPLAPSGTITTPKPTFTWSRISGATKYQFAVYQGTTTTLAYPLQAVATSLCGSSATNCSNTPTTALSDGAYTWKVQAYVGGATWRPYSASKSFTIKTIPTPISPKGTITDSTPTFTWSRISAATYYSFSVYLFDNRGTTLVYSKTVAASACGSTTCSNTPTTALSPGAYTWKVRAYVSGWKAYSATKSFTIAVPKPKAGFWQSTTGEEWFYVSPDQDYVEEFSIHEDWGCLWWDYYYLSMPISNHSFSFDDGLGWSASGTFTSYTTASGQDTLNNYFPPVCYDEWYTDTWSYTAKWINDCQDLSQPLSQRTSNSCEYLPHR